MKFVDLSTLEITTELDVLKRDTQPNSFFLYQHKGIFFADNSRIGNQNQQEAEQKYINVIKKAKQDNISLLLTPEYSCPKSVVDKIINEIDLQPSDNKVWVLSGESLNKVELQNLKSLEHDNLHIHFEDVYTHSDKNYVDPLYYIFRGKYKGVSKLIIIVQFKTHHMGVWTGGDVERDNLIEGNNIYIIKNNNNSVRLLSFICSEAMNVNSYLTDEKKDEYYWNDMPFLILHPQINPDPSHNDFIDFRKGILKSNKKEVVSLNWGRETYVRGNNWYENRGNTPRSGIFFKTREINQSEAYISNNHKKGLYFLKINRDKFVYYLNGDIDLIHFNNTSVDIVDGVPAQQRREGPKVSNIYKFDNFLNFEKIETINDNHISFLSSRGVTNLYLLNVHKSVINKERLLNISMGNVVGKEGKKWAEIINLNSFNLRESDECNNRLTYIEDTYESSQVVRRDTCTNIIELDLNILPHSKYYPHSIKHLESKSISLAFSENADFFGYRYNVVNSFGEIEKATICYIGNSDFRVAKKTYSELQKLFDSDSTDGNTVVVFYKKGNDILNMSKIDAGSITQTPINPTSITD